ncbi:PEPxxWA-CTERM sorting domain-containing protein [Bradyrhizobium sp.]|uniref:PEPxxWA-CTERM sorting domain-containing protein n=1 Tax=Bradyrhizobium sp. TaxID=376 RepID=UPI003BAF39CB
MVPSIAELYGINYSGFGAGNWPEASDAFPTLTGSLIASPVPEPSTWSMLLIGFAAIGFAVRSRRPTPLRHPEPMPRLRPKAV